MVHPEIETTDDGFLGQKIHVWQPKQGYRGGSDAVLLAASFPRNAGKTVADIGCGVGISTLCAYHRCPDMAFTGIDCVPELIDLAEKNAARNQASAVSFHVATLGQDPPIKRYDYVITNPPFYREGKGTPSAHALRHNAFFRHTSLAEWIQACFDWIVPGGSLYLIYPLKSLAELQETAPLFSVSLLVPYFSAERPFSRCLARLTMASPAMEVFTSPAFYDTNKDYTSYGYSIFYEAHPLLWHPADIKNPYFPIDDIRKVIFSKEIA